VFPRGIRFDAVEKLRLQLDVSNPRER
jgi:hypothetical protein